MSRFKLLFAVVCVCVMATTAWAAKPAGLLAEWNFDEGKGDALLFGDAQQHLQFLDALPLRFLASRTTRRKRTGHSHQESASQLPGPLAEDSAFLLDLTPLLS